MNELTISIVTYNGVGKIEHCLKSLHAQTYNDYKIIVVDNASSDGTIAAITNISPEAKIIQNAHNVGFGAGHNIAIRESSTPYVLVLNQDVILQPKAIETMLSAARQSQAAAVGPLLLRPGSVSNQIVDTAGLVKRFWWQVSDRGSSRPMAEHLKRPGFVWGISGACILLRRDALDAVAYIRPDGKREYFDETFFMYKEDVDLAVRLRRKGYKAWYEAEAIGVHARTGFAGPSLLGQAGHRAQLPAYVREYSYRNHWFLLIKHAWLWQLVFILPYEALKGLFLLLTSPRTLARAWPEIVKNFMPMLRRRYG